MMEMLGKVQRLFVRVICNYVSKEKGFCVVEGIDERKRGDMKVWKALTLQII